MLTRRYSGSASWPIDAAKTKSRINTAKAYTKLTNHHVFDMPGRWVTTRCPFHDDHRPSLRVLIPDGAFRCMACGMRGGDIINFVMKLFGYDFKQAVDYLHRNFGVGP